MESLGLHFLNRPIACTYKFIMQIKLILVLLFYTSFNVPVLSNAGSTPISQLCTSATLLSRVAGNECEVGVASNDLTFIPSFMKIR
jgi:hypothetical protein